MSDQQSNDLLALLQDISQAAEENALPMPDEQTQQDDWRGIGFRLGQHTFVVSMAQVDEILNLPAWTKVPGVKSWLNGIANVRGRLLSVVDLGSLLGKAAFNRTPKSRLLTVRQDDLYCGLLVDEVLGLQTFSAQERQQVTELDPSIQAYAKDGYEKGGQLWPVFNLHQLTGAAEFLSAAR